MSCFQVSLDGFRAKRFNCLVATDVAGRGIDIPVCPCSSLPNSMWYTPCYRGFLLSVRDIIRESCECHDIARMAKFQIIFMVECVRDHVVIFMG